VNAAHAVIAGKGELRCATPAPLRTANVCGAKLAVLIRAYTLELCCPRCRGRVEVAVSPDGLRVMAHHPNPQR
jgi:hypothetical protein